MKSIKILSAILVISIISMGCSQAISYSDESVNRESSSRAVTAKKPFPHKSAYPNITKPNHKTTEALDADVESFYGFWKGLYVKEALSYATDGGYYIAADANGSEPQSWKDAGVTPKSQSEAHGYGMVISAYMADKEVYDGLYAIYCKFRSTQDSNLMSWILPHNEDTNFRDTAATDGDLDIAYSLLLADNQWGSDTGINYKAEALRVITAIKNSHFDGTSYRAMLGDWGNFGDKYYSRSSDWMVSHFRTFYNITEDTFWLSAIDEVYKMITDIQTNYSPVTNLIPDFIVGSSAKPDDKYFLEGQTDDDYSWNASRTPWRIAMDYALFGTAKSKDALDGFVTWAKAECSESIWNYKAGYKLNGEALVTYSNNAFTAPLTFAATNDPSHQQFINDSWDILIRHDDWNKFFGDTITMQCLILISGNWWIPASDGPIGDIEPPQPYSSTVIINKNTGTEVHFWWGEFTDNVGVVRYEHYLDGVYTGSSTEARYELTGLTPETKYSHKVYAFDAAGNKSVGIGGLFWTNKAAPDTEAPTVPQNFNASVDGNGTVNLTWSKSSDNVAVKRYIIHVYYPRYGYYGPTYYTTDTSYSFPISNITSGNDLDSYLVRVRSEDTSSNMSYWTTDRVINRPSGSDVPEDPAATGKPNSFQLQQTKWGGQNTYGIKADMWYGQNATVLKLYENGVLVETKKPSFNTPNAQTGIVFNFSNKPKGTYTYKLEAINQYGTTTSTLSYTVTQ